jgi:hypothetical protein
VLAAVGVEEDGAQPTSLAAASVEEDRVRPHRRRGGRRQSIQATVIGGKILRIDRIL